MNWLRIPLIWAGLAAMAGCATYRDVKEVKMVGFSDDLSKGKSVGQFESDDCVYHLFGYSLGGQPDLSRAMANARTRKKSAITDVVAGDTVKDDGAIRYAANVTAEYGGFSAGIFGKNCITVKGVGYL